ncbi:MAG TPA: hypothetical protein VMT62_16265 [Syntrophorhabdaceae bacterium]|nr:hypothetical protein [Syntrophorhabdaceae bacterium]
MIDLAVDFMGIRLKNPLVVASADIGRSVGQIRKAEQCGAAAVIVKGMLPDDSSELKSVMRVLVDEKAQTVYGAAGASRLSYTGGIEVIKAAKKETSMKIGACMPYLPVYDPAVIAEGAKEAVKAGADFIEVNFKPQVTNYLAAVEKMDKDATDAAAVAEKTGEYMREVLSQISEGVRIMKQAVDVPVIAKLSPDGVDILSQAIVASKAGIDGIDAIGSTNGAFKIDIHDGGRTAIPCAQSGIFLLSGAMLKPHCQNAVTRISKTLTVPVLATGGLMTWTDVVETIMFGAGAVSFCALLMIHGFEALKKLNKGLSAYMEKQGYESLDDFRGLALNHVAPSMAECEIIPSVARIDTKKCSGCGRCLRLGHCIAISLSDRKAMVDAAQCLGCASCFVVCPKQAVSMIKI